MFTYKVDEQIQLKLINQKDADEIFALIDSNRAYFREWLGWLDGTKEVADTYKFISLNLHKYADGAGIDTAIVYEGEIVGKVTIHQIDTSTKTAHIGYMLGEQFTGKGIMTKAVQAMMRIAFEELGMNKIEIQAAVGNAKSRAIPERLGFTKEGISRQSEWLYDHYVDHAVYSLLKSEWQR